MTPVTYWRLSLLLPLLLPALFSPFLQPGAPPLLALIAIVLLSSMVYGGLPYVLLAAGTLWWSLGKDEEQVIGALVLAPLLMVPLVTLQTVVLYLTPVSHGSPEAGFGGTLLMALQAALYFSCWTVGLGYLYVALAWTLGRFFLRLGWVREAEEETAGSAP